MKSRYTGKSLEADVIGLNAKLEAANHPLRFVVGYRYNYTAVDLATPEQMARHCTQRTGECGTPRECLAYCYKYIATNL
jgi:hypothetical protein